jgi:ubiquinone/menaquinone biosynthesis C-methylase UbiE
MSDAAMPAADLHDRSSNIIDAGNVTGRVHAEYGRLQRLAADWDQATSEVLDGIGIEPGMRCLDVGSGAGAVLRLMAERVGPTGQVVGLDKEGPVGQLALMDLHRQGYRQVSFRRGDVNQTAAFAAGSFDVVFARFFLMHMLDPARTLRRLYEWVRPGGWLIVQDYDLEPLDIHPALPSFAAFRRICFTVMEQTDRDVRLGIKLRSLFMQGGAGAPDGSCVHARQTTLVEAADTIAAVYRGLLPLALELGVCNDREGMLAQRILELPDKRAYAVLWPLFHSAWKRKAASGYPDVVTCRHGHSSGLS